MDRRELWPDFRPEWILHEDRALLAIAKPAGVSSQSADPSWPDDVVTRARRFLAERDGAAFGDVRLGVHQRLDRDTSGVLVLARSPAASPSLARQFEGRTVEKRYVAGVRGWPKGEREATLRDRLARDRGGLVRVARGRDAGARAAVTHVRVRERRGDRTLLDVAIETGRTHQIRAQLAHRGAPVAGDRLYDGGHATRLMLHAASIALEHPETGRPARFEAPLPPELDHWLAGEDAASISDRASLDLALAAAAEARWGIARAATAPSATTAFRLVNADGDAVPGVAADVYGDHLVAHLYGDDAIANEATILDALDALGFDGIYVKRRPRQANVVVDARASHLAPADPVRGSAAAPEIVILENGLPYLVRLGDGLSTGLFLDQRDNRRRIRELADGARVLNLFAYTCGFTLAAAAGGASRTVSVDASRAALDRGERLLAHAGVGGDHRFVAADAFEALDSFARAREAFDLVVVDPPTYSTTRASRWTSGGDWRRLAASVMRVVAAGGRVLACSNDRRLASQKLRRLLHEASRDAGRRVVQMKDLPVPSDFPAPASAEPHEKSILLTLA